MIERPSSPRILFVFLGHVPAGAQATYGDYDGLCLDGMGTRPAALHDLIDQPTADPPDTSAFDGVILSGGASMVTDNGAWLRTATQLVRTALAAEVPLLGICLGHQVLAHAAGAKVGVHRDRWALGVRDVHLHASAASDPLLGNATQSFKACVSHRQAVLETADGIEVLGATVYDAYHVIRVGPCAWGAQFHPEFTPAYLRAAIDRRAAALDSELGAGTADHERERLCGTPVAQSILTRFVALAWQRRHASAKTSTVAP